MTLSGSPSPSFLESQDTVSVPEREYFRAQTQREAYNLVLERFAELSADHGALRSAIAKRLNKNRAQITRLLSEPSNITLDTLSDLLLAMGSQVKMTQCEIGSEAKGNYIHPSSIHCMQVSDVAKNNTAVTKKSFSPNLAYFKREKNFVLKGDLKISGNKSASLEFI